MLPKMQRSQIRAFRLAPVSRIQARLARLASSVLILLLAGALISCSGGKSGGRKQGQTEDADASVPELQEKVKGLLEKAKAAGMDKAASEDYERVEKYVKDGDGFAESGDEEKARKKYSTASRQLKSFLDEQGKVKEAVAKLADVRKEAEDAKKKADTAKASKSAADIYQQANEAYESAVESMEKAASSTKVSQAKTKLEQAKTLFAQAAQVAAENETFRRRAESEKQAVATLKDKAKKAGAEEKALRQWESATAQEREADDLLERGDFRSAVEAYKSASQGYTASIEAVQDQEKFEKMTADAAEREKQYLEEMKKQQVAEATKETAEGDATAEAQANRAPGPVAGPQSEAGAAQTAIELFENYDPSKYPQELDAEDEAFLELSYKKLVKAEVLEYDPQTGAVKLDYTVGKDVRKDLIKLDPQSKVEFESAMIPTKRGMSPEELKKFAPFSLAGNTRGFVAFPVPFKYYVRVDYDMQILTMTQSGTFTVVVMMDQKSFNGFAAQWLATGMLQRGVPKVGRAPAGFTKSADTWFDKTRAIPMLVEYKMPDPDKGGDPLKSGKFSITYDVGGPKTATNSLSSAAYSGGVVGFLWNMTKFEVRSLTITGILDKKTAVEMLRKQLGVKKEGAEAKDTKDSKTKKDKSSSGSQGKPVEKPTEKPKAADAGKEGGAEKAGDAEKSSDSEESSQTEGASGAEKEATGSEDGKQSEASAGAPAGIKKKDGGGFDF